MLRGRDPLAMLAPLAAAGVTTVVACAPESPRALPAEHGGRGGGRPRAEGGRRADGGRRRGPGPHLVPSDGLLLVAGSLYVVADARGVLAAGPPGAERAGPGPPGGW